jgi:hypothetical protein
MLIRLYCFVDHFLGGKVVYKFKFDEMNLSWNNFFDNNVLYIYIYIYILSIIFP